MAVVRCAWLIAGIALCGARGLRAQSVPPASPAASGPVRFVTQPLAPYTFANEQGRAAGPMADVLREVCKKLAWACTVEVLPWRRALGMAQRAEVEGIFNVVDTPERRQYFYISHPVVDARYVWFARAGSSWQFNGDRRSLDGLVLGSYGPSAASLTVEELIQGLPAARSEIEPDNRTALRKLAAGRYGDQGLVLANEVVAQQLIREDGLHLQAAGLVRVLPYSFGFNRQVFSREQAGSFGRVVQEMCRTGRLAEVLKPYGLTPSACLS